MARRQSRVMTEEEDTELNMTPMLDVVFILLIF
ncbi:MAG TPA: biopolymer transporter ExbD, partial [Oceanicaulis sp.]|nr:biopolymer transporter ExbD [Oceanicaulis sp.]